MTTGLSLHLGLNSVDPNHYGGWSGPLVACEADARDMTSIAASCGFTTSTLLTEKATRDSVLGTISTAAGKLAPGDIFLLTNSSHGGQVPDQNGDEDDGADETWCLYDGELIDDELYFALSEFAAGVRIVVISDSCHSGTVIKSPELRAIYGDMLSTQAAILGLARPNADGAASSSFLGSLMGTARPKSMPLEIMSRTYFENKEFYDAIAGREELRDAKSAVKASAILLSGCQDNQTSMDGAFNGAFTGMLKAVWNGGRFSGGYEDFLVQIRGKLPPTQSPNYFRIGAHDPHFEAQVPFTIS